VQKVAKRVFNSLITFSKQHAVSELDWDLAT